MSHTNPIRKRLVPEVVQTSAMDCGPAALGSFLQGHRIPISYPALRQACHTDLDGTSIDTLEELARDLGLDAEQVMIPADHFLLPKSDNLPAILIVNNPDGATHFVVIWRKSGHKLQIMDPAIGRRWVDQKQLLDEAFRHRMRVPTEDWHEWARSDDFLVGLGERLRVATRSSGKWIESATAHHDWRAVARLDAVARLTASLIDAKLLRAGHAARKFVDAMMNDDSIANVDDIPAEFWSAFPLEDRSELQLRGIVLIRSRGATRTIGHNGNDPNGCSGHQQRLISPLRYLAAKLAARGPAWCLLVFCGLLLAAGSVVLEALLFRGAMEITSQLRLTEQRWVAVGYFVAFIAAMLVVEWNVVGAILAAGRRLEIGLRVDFLENLTQLKDRYFGSRPISDMAHRAHNVHHLRELPVLAGQAVLVLLTIVLTATALCLVFPGGRVVAVLAAMLAILLPLIFRRQLVERDLKVRTHAGALANSYFDALVGLVPIRAHGAEQKMRRQHEALLTKWAASSLQLVDSIVMLESLILVTGFGLAALLVYLHFRLGENPAGSLLIAYWALHLPVLGDQLAELFIQYPFHRNLIQRAIEPIRIAAGAELQRHSDAIQPTTCPADRGGMELELGNVTVTAGGHPIISNIDLQVTAEEHVAIVGISGAGKSSLAGLLLGLHEPDQGEVRIDGIALDDESIPCLREKTAWVDPQVRLWNDTLLANLTAGRQQSPSAVGRVLKETGLDRWISRLPDGLQTVIGENGKLLSAGQAQLVRFARALLKPDCELAILDEPLFGVEVAAQPNLIEHAREHWRKATLLLVTHQMQQALTFSRVIVMAGGRIHEDGCPHALSRDSSSLFSSLLAAERQLQQQHTSPPWRTARLTSRGIFETPHLNLSTRDRTVKRA